MHYLYASLPSHRLNRDCGNAFMHYTGNNLNHGMLNHDASDAPSRRSVGLKIYVNDRVSL